MKNFVKISVFVLILLVLFTNANAMGRQVAATFYLNKKAPDFSLYDLEGNKITLSDFKGKKQVMLFFWYIMCPLCGREITEINEIYPEIENSDIEFLSINVGDSSNIIKRYKSRRPIYFPVLLDTNQQVAIKYSLEGVPTYVVIDKSGVIRSIDHSFPEHYEKLISE